METVWIHSKVSYFIYTDWEKLDKIVHYLVLSSSLYSHRLLPNNIIAWKYTHSFSIQTYLLPIHGTKSRNSILIKKLEKGPQLN